MSQGLEGEAERIKVKGGPGSDKPMPHMQDDSFEDTWEEPDITEEDESE